MVKKYIIILVAISFLLTNCIAFLDEGIRTFDYLKHAGDWIALFIYTILFVLIPFFIFFLRKEKPKTKFIISLAGFSPVLVFILIQL